MNEPPISEEYKSFIDVFSKEEGESLPDRTQFDHTIDLESSKMPPYKPIYELSLKEQKVLRTLKITWKRPHNRIKKSCRSSNFVCA